MAAPSSTGPSCWPARRATSSILASSGPLNGVVPPTGKRFAARQSHWFRVENGKLAEHWATREDLVAMLQLGVVQPPGRPPS